MLCDNDVVRIEDAEDGTERYQHTCKVCGKVRPARRARLNSPCTGPQAAPAPGVNRTPCIYQGEQIGETPCTPCGGSKLVPLYACQLHEKCTTAARSKDVTYCLSCADYANGEPLPPTRPDVFVLGYPGPMGGANTELWHTVKLWRQMGLRVTLIPTWGRDWTWENKLREIGAHTQHVRKDKLEETPFLAGATVVSFCNAQFLENAHRLRAMGCRLVWANCMTWLFPAERKFCEEQGPFDAYLFQSQFQKDMLAPTMVAYGAGDDQFFVIRGAFDATEMAFAPASRMPGDPFVVGRISRPDLDKWSSNLWNIYGAIQHPHRRARVMAWSEKLTSKCGAAPEWAETLSPMAEPADVFLRKLHCLIPVNGGARENWPRAGLEAMACGVPIVTQAQWGWKEMIIHGHTGFLAKTDKELAAYADLLASDEVLRMEMAVNARRHLLLHLANPSALGKQWVELLEFVRTLSYA